MTRNDKNIVPFDRMIDAAEAPAATLDGGC
jgi:hypothetical protein